MSAVVPARTITGILAADRTLRKQRREKRSSAVLWLSAGWMLLVVTLVMLQGVLPLPDPNRSDYAAMQALPFVTPGHLLGTDEVGRDILARVIAGAQVSLIAGIGSVLVGVIIGLPLGVAAGYFGRTTNVVISGALDVMLAFPGLIALIALTVFVGPSLWTVVIGMGVVFSPAVARVARSSTLLVAGREYVVAARGTGAGTMRVLIREVLPNVVVPVLAYAMVLVAQAIVIESSLSFLGLGVPPPQASWGGMMGTGRAEMAEHPHIIIVPAVAMFLSLLALNFLAEAFGRRFDVKEAAL